MFYEYKSVFVIALPMMHYKVLTKQNESVLKGLFAQLLNAL